MPRLLGVGFGGFCVGHCLTAARVAPTQEVLVIIAWAASVSLIVSMWFSLDEYTWPVEATHA